VPFVSTDINGIQRNYGSVDIGAYEYYEIPDTTTPVPTGDIVSVSIDTSGWFAFVEIEGLDTNGTYNLGDSITLKPDTQRFNLQYHLKDIILLL
jgi:hypothetical protein